MSEQSYDLGLHIGSIFIIMGASLVGVLIPVGLGHLENACVQPVIWSAKGFGTGVILSTGFVHLLGEAGEKLEVLANQTDYEAWPYVFAMAMIMVMASIDFAATYSAASTSKNCEDTTSGFLDMECPHGHGHGHGHSIYSASSRSCEGADDKGSSSVEKKKKKAAVWFLEAGILSHSVL